MRILAILIFLACSISSCSNESDGPPNVPPYPSHQAIINSPTSSGIYTTYEDTVNLSGPRDSTVSVVTWEDTSTGATGSGIVDSYWHSCCFLFSCWDCLEYYWYALDVPLQNGENMIKIYANGSWADSITVTRTPSFGLSGTVTYAGTGQRGLTLALVDTANASHEYTTHTDAAGFYSFRFIPSGTYTLAITDPCYTFTPPNLLISGTTTDIVEQSFLITAKSAAVLSGRITFINGGAGVYGAAVALSNASTLTYVLTDRDGNYAFTCVQDGSYVITPSLSPRTFDPGSINVTVTAGTDVSDLNFQMN